MTDARQAPPERVEDVEFALLQEAVVLRYGVDLRAYSQAGLRRSIRTCMQSEDAGTVTGLQARLMHDPACLERLLLQLSTRDEIPFHDVALWQAFRERVVPRLR